MPMRRTTTGRTGGFTLIELLMVMAVISLLIGLLLPGLQRARALAMRAFCQKNLQNVAVAMRMYLDQSDEVMPSAAQLPSARLNDLPRIADVLKPHLGNQDNLKCPADTGRKYYLSEGSSYEYASIFGGRRVDQTFLTKRFGLSRTPVMYDYEPFHGPAGEVGSANYLFADGHAGWLE